MRRRGTFRLPDRGITSQINLRQRAFPGPFVSSLPDHEGSQVRKSPIYDLSAARGSLPAVCNSMGRCVQDRASDLCLPFDGIGARRL